MIAGARPTGHLHIGHLIGALGPFVEVAADMDEAYFVVADLHMFTTHATLASTSKTHERTRQLIIECIAAGLDPAWCSFYVQSSVLEMGQLNAILASLVEHERLLNQPSYVAMREALTDSKPSLGLLGYPVLECADVIGIGATHVAVGEHNVHHVDLCRSILDRLRDEWGLELPIPNPVTGGPNLVGLDGGPKMSKSLGNTIQLVDREETVIERVRRMAIWDEMGRCVPADYISAFGDPDTAAEINIGLREGTIRETDALECVVASVESVLAPIRSKLQEAEAMVDEVLGKGAADVSEIAKQQLASVRSALSMSR